MCSQQRATKKNERIRVSVECVWLEQIIKLPECDRTGTQKKINENELVNHMLMRPNEVNNPHAHTFNWLLTLKDDWDKNNDNDIINNNNNNRLKSKQYTEKPERNHKAQQIDKIWRAQNNSHRTKNKINKHGQTHNKHTCSKIQLDGITCENIK